MNDSNMNSKIAGPVGTMPSGVPVAIIVIAAVLLALQAELRLAAPLLVGVTAVMAMTLAVVFYCGEQGRFACSPAVILAVALVLRLLFMFAPPQLSDDIYRYLWDGSNLLRGNNPYATAPAKVKAPPDLATIHARINHPEYVTIYPPAAQLVFAGGAATGETITRLKAFLVLFDMGLCIILLVVLQRLELPLWRALLYAWNPLPVLEIAGSGHVDGAGMALLLGAVCLLLPPGKQTAALRPWLPLLCGALLACAGLVKLFPLVLTPILFLLTPRGGRRYFVLGFGAALAALVLPFLPQLANSITSLDSYARNWEFAGFAFNTLRALTGSGTIARMMLSSGFLAAVFGITLHYYRSMKRAPAPVDRGRLAINACYAIAMALLLLTPTLQSWYALSLAAFLPFCAGPAGLVLCWVVFLTYRVQLPYFILGQWTESPQVTAAVFLAPVIAFLLSKKVKNSNRFQARFNNISPQDKSIHPC